ncbi:nuclear transport factor 2 family protein [Nocardia concava]|uniref:nuclear transport factor 2 family protein n=1 Tax=Nocardia concava TaxID=257281 RepID=UPI0002DA8542|nr:nuclear transport factor 2 family protein [Nocardia concava]
MSEPERTRHLYADLQHFYAAQMRLLDDGFAEEWAATFEPDGSLVQSHRSSARKGRADIADGLRRTVERLRASGTVRRHWIGNITIENDSAAADVIHTRYYALIVESDGEQAPRVHLSADIRDQLVPDRHTWLVRERTITHDPVPTTTPGK